MRETFPDLPYFSRTPRKMIPKNTVLTLLETGSSRFILFLLISPILALLAGFACSHWKYTQHTAYCAFQTSGSTTPNSANEIGCSQEGSSLVFRSLVQGSSLRSSIIPVFSSSPMTDRLKVVIKATSPDKEETLRASYSLDRWQELSYIQPDGTVSFGLPLPFLDLSDFSSSPTITMNIETDGVPQAMQAVRVRLVEETAAYRQLSASLKLWMIMLTLAFILWCTRRTLVHALHLFQEASEQLPKGCMAMFSIFHFILPEHFTCFFSHLAFICWLHPISLLVELGFLDSSAHQGLLAIGQAFSLCGGYGLLCLLKSYLDGLRQNSNPLDERALVVQAQEEEPLAEPDAMLRLQSVIHSIYTTFLTRHHPRASEFLDFILPNVTMFCLSCLLAITREVLLLAPTAPPPAEIASFTDWIALNKTTLLSVLDICLLFVAWTWIVSIVQAYWLTKRELQRTRYMQSRLRQVAYRIIMLQIGLMMIVGLVIAIYLLYQQLHRLTMLRHAESVFVYSYAWLTYYGWLYPWLGRNSADAQSLEVTVFLFVLLANLCWSFLPATTISQDNHIQTFQPLRRMLREQRGLEKGKEPFCLELACYLLEASYQSYFPPPDPEKSYHMRNDIFSLRRREGKPLSSSHGSSSLSVSSERIERESVGGTQQQQQESDCFVSGPRLDLSRLGLHSCGIFSCSAFNTFGFFGRVDDGEIVVSFRGSTLANILSDFKFSQIPLPDLKRPPSFFIEAFSFMECQGNPFAKMTNHHHPLEPAGYTDGGFNLSAQSFDPVNNHGVYDRLRAMGTSILNALPICNQALPRVHLGFWESYASIRDEFMTKIAQTLFLDYSQQEALSPSSMNPVSSSHSLYSSQSPLRILFTGHSLGAAMAVLAALELVENLSTIVHAMHLYNESSSMNSSVHSNLTHLVDSVDSFPAEISIYCFGCPRVGNAAFAKKVEKEVHQCYRVQVDGDIVAMLPKFLGFYRHIGTAVLLDEQVSGNIVIRPTVLEQALFRRVTGTIANHSLEKYRLCLEACFEPEDYAEYLATEYCYLNPSNASKAPMPTWMNPV
eukprot:gene9621-10636_t